MALQFVFAFVVQLGLAVFPGFLFLISIGCALDLSLAMSIAVGSSLYSIASVILCALSIYGAAPLLCSVLSFSVLVFVFYLICQKQNTAKSSICILSGCGSPAKKRAFQLFLFVMASVAVFTAIYTKNVSGFNGFVQFDDNATHLAAIETSARYGYYNALFPCTSNPFSDYVTSGPSYYPGAYYILPALSIALTGTNAATAELASATVFCAVAYASGFYMFAKLVFQGDKNTVLCMMPMILASTAFPLRMLIVHAPYPNIAGFSMVPSYLAAALMLFRPTLTDIKSRLILFFLCLSTLVFMHPNSAIYAVVFVFPYILFNYVPMVVSKKYGPRPRATAIVVAMDAALLFCSVAIWAILLQTSFMSGIVSFIWEWHSTLSSILISIIDGGLLLGMPQLAFGLLTIVGAFVLLRNRNTRWLVISFLIFAFQFIATGIGSNEVKSIVAGFWYTDPERLAAMIAMSMIPLAAAALSFVVRWISDHASIPLFRNDVIVGIAVSLIFTLLNFFPYYLYPGSTNKTSFGQTFYEVDSNTRKDEYSCYSASEAEFIQRVIEYVEPDDVILNLPFDGSTFAYSVDGLNLYYPYRVGSGESIESQLIRTSLNRYCNDDKVREAVRAIGAEYVLVLDRSAFSLQNEHGLMSAPGMNYYSGDWTGITSLNDKTLGFTPVISDGDLRLYKICDVD